MRKERFTPDELWGVIESSSYADLNAPYFMPWFASIAEDEAEDELVRDVARQLLQWDRALTRS